MEQIINFMGFGRCLSAHGIFGEVSLAWIEFGDKFGGFAKIPLSCLLATIILITPYRMDTDETQSYYDYHGRKATAYWIIGYDSLLPKWGSKQSLVTCLIVIAWPVHKLFD